MNKQTQLGLVIAGIGVVIIGGMMTIAFQKEKVNNVRGRSKYVANKFLTGKPKKYSDAFSQEFPISRDARRWPFSQDSIWNIPIGSNAQYVPGNIEIPNRFTTDEDIIILHPDAPLTDLYYTDISWGSSAREYRSRCERTGGLIRRFPIPFNYTFIASPNTTPNAGVAVLLEDGESIFQGQPFSRCDVGGYATMRYPGSRIQNIYGPGYYGAHGGSGLSAIGGTIRVGELMPGSVIRHVMKVNLYAARNLAYFQDGSPGYRWPALRSDSYASGVYGGSNAALEMGSLLALRPDFNVNSLRTEPARILAQAFRDYGAYVVDDTAWNAAALVIEVGPDGDVAEEFEDEYGYPIRTSDSNSPWYQDLASIFSQLHVIDNNSEGSIGGGGTPRQPLAPPFPSVSTDDPT